MSKDPTRTSRIDARYAQLAHYRQDSLLRTDLAAIDRAMDELRAELVDVPPGREEVIVQQMIANYRLKLQLLERVLEHIEQFDYNSGGTPPDKNIRRGIPPVPSATRRRLRRTISARVNPAGRRDAARCRPHTPVSRRSSAGLFSSAAHAAGWRCAQ